jgi:phosphoenolpyruvate carboxykinase (GTP)
MTKREVESWVADIAGHLRPTAVRWCDGSESEAEEITTRLLTHDDSEQLDERRFPRSFIYRSHPSDVARTENLTFICSNKGEDAGPTNNWMSPDEATRSVWPLFQNAMAGRRLYVVPYLMGPRELVAELEQNQTFLRTFGERMPAALTREHDGLRSRLCAAIS